MADISTIKNRIEKFIESQGIKRSVFERSCGLSNGYIRNLKENPSAAKIEDILSMYPELNRVWLLSGEGEMLKSDNPPTPKKSYTQGAPYYDVDFVGGFDAVINDQTLTPSYLIDFRMYNDATCWCNVTGHSMEPEINHGDIIALKKIDDFSFLPFGEIYAIVTKNELRTIKRIGPANSPDCYTLIPTNTAPEYGTQELPKSMIQAVFQVMGCMKRL